MLYKRLKPIWDNVRKGTLLASILSLGLLSIVGTGGGGGNGVNHGTLQFSSATYSVTEDTATVTITVTRTGGSAGAVSVDYTTADGTADSSDYTATSGTLNWTDSDAADKTFTVTILDDGIQESSEDFTVSLSNVVTATLGTPSTATVTITDDDNPGTVQFSSATYNVSEGAGTVTITVTRTGGSNGPASVQYTTANDTAEAGTDYDAISGPPNTLNWTDGDAEDKNFTVTILDDGIQESSEDFTVSLSNVVTATLGTPNTATITINDDDSAVACVSTANDSVQTPTGWIRIHSESFGTYYLETLSRETLGGGVITMDYMVHEPPAAPSALLVLIGGGQLATGIVGVDGMTPTSAGANFLVRSAHLFAAQGYRVLTIDRPSDYLDYTGGGVAGSDYDGYRTSMAHAVDLSQLINVVNAADNLPVIIAGTSRGSISAVAQHALASAVAISAPLTSGDGTPIGTGNVLPANVPEPVHVSWHELDACVVTTPADAQSLVGDFPDAVGVAISGGFASASSTSPCNADHYHGFPGIESCAVKLETDWMAVELASLPATRPVASPQIDFTSMNTQKLIDVTGFATASVGGALTYSLPHASTSLGGSISIAGTSITYDPPASVSNVVDTFVYVVSEAGGGTSHNVIEVTINP